MSDASTLFTLLGDRHRRRILFSLCQGEGGPLAIPQDVRTPGRAREQSRRHDDTMQMIDPEQPTEQLEVELHHTHLPKLEEAGLIRWDCQTDMVSRGPMFEVVEPALQTLVDNAETFPPDLL